jgi:membrane protein DedA with SNARE-associated domain
MSGLVEGLLSLHGWLALLLIFLLPALEAPAFLGMILPGELALVLGGVLAHEGRVPLAAAIAVGIAGAVAGDSVGYWIGHRWNAAAGSAWAAAHVMLGFATGEGWRRVHETAGRAALFLLVGAVVLGALGYGVHRLLRRRRRRSTPAESPRSAPSADPDEDRTRSAA